MLRFVQGLCMRTDLVSLLALFPPILQGAFHAQRRRTPICNYYMGPKGLPILLSGVVEVYFLVLGHYVRKMETKIFIIIEAPAVYEQSCGVVPLSCPLLPSRIRVATQGKRV